MEIFRDIYISCNAEQFAALADEVERSLRGGWARDKAEEERMRSLPLRGGTVACFSCTQDGARPAATVFLMERRPGTFYASNVVPKLKHQLEYREYNGVLEEFFGLFLRPCAERAGVRVELTATQAELENWLSPAAAERLRKFSAAANKSAAASHPSDRERWNAFVVTAHDGKCSMDASTLRRWLVEVEGWPPELATRLAADHETGRELLAFAEEHRRSA